jgi:hypothetical protein
MGLSDLKYLPYALKELARYAVVESEFFDSITPKGISQKHLDGIYDEIDSAVEGGHAFKVLCGIRDAQDYAQRRRLPFDGVSAKENVIKLKSSIPERNAKYLDYSQKDTSLQGVYQKILMDEKLACQLALNGRYPAAVDVYIQVLKLRGAFDNKATSTS